MSATASAFGCCSTGAEGSETNFDLLLDRENQERTQYAGDDRGVTQRTTQQPASPRHPSAEV